MIVDDERETCDLIQRVVNSAGMVALTLTNSAQATSFLSEGKFDLVFLDFHMPPPDGVELARAIRRSSPNRTTPVVLISDDQRPSALSIGFEAGASFFLYKPIDKDRLSRFVRATQGVFHHEKRCMRRVQVRQKILLSSGAEDLEAHTVDMSLNGILVKSHRTFPLGTSVNLTLQLSQGMKPVSAVGSIARIEGGTQMGIHLDRLTPADSERLQDFLLPLIPDGE